MARRKVSTITAHQRDDGFLQDPYQVFVIISGSHLFFLSWGGRDFLQAAR
jgi:hypothetical protein